MAFNTNQLYNLGQLRQICAQDCGNGVYDPSTGIWDYDTTTFPTLSRANQMINDTIREICAYDFQFLESINSYPFIHTIENVQSLYVSGTSISGTAISGTLTPYPADVLNYSWTANNSIANLSNNFSGISFVGTQSNGISVAGISNTGTVTTATWTGLGFNYQLNPDVDKLLNPAVWIAHSTNGQQTTANGVFLQNIDYEDIIRQFPIGLPAASGTPQYVATSPGLSDSNNNGYSIVMAPSPTFAYSGNTFLLFYKKLHQTMVDDTDVQTSIPSQFQNCISAMSEAKIFQLSNPERAAAQISYANDLIKSMRLWDWAQPSKVRQFRDANYGAGYNAAYDNSVWFRVGSLNH